jgi:ABC-type phosphate/phosphonate transport system substrate-binding protein
MIVNARMYSVTPATKAAWRAVLSWIMARAGVAWDFVDHEPPLLLSELWAREDLGLVMMCGLPFSRRVSAAQLVAAPVPAPPQYGGQAIYMSYLAVRADARYARLEDTFGRTAGYTLKDSQSGYFAFRHYLLAHYGRDDQYENIVGGLMNPRGIVRALADGRIDVGPLDSFVFDLIRASDAEFAAQVKVIAATDPTPMPAIVCSASVNPDTLTRLREACLEVSDATELAGARATLLLERFIVPDPGAYRVQHERATMVAAAGRDWP